MAGETTNDSELDVEVAGQKVRAKGYRLVDLIWLPMVLGIAYTCMMLYQHNVDAQTDKKQVAETLKSSNSEIAQALKESNLAIVGAIKESNEKTISALNKLTSQASMISCLSDPVVKNRSDAREFCKRMSRGDN